MFTSWTPREGLLIDELFRRALRHDDTVVGISPTLALDHDLPSPAVVSLSPQAIGGHPWRQGWAVTLSNAAGARHLLSVDAPTCTLVGGGWSARLFSLPRTLDRAPAEGAAVVHLTDAAFNKPTRQSSATGVDEHALGPWMLPTEPELEPWWEIDLGASLFVSRVRLWLASPRGTLVVEAFAYPSPLGAVPAGAWRRKLAAAEDVTLEVNTVARFVRVRLESAEPVVLAIRGAEVLSAELVGPTLLATWQRVFTLFAERPLFASADDGFTQWTTYERVWARVRRLVRNMPRFGGEPVFMAICAATCPEWVIADLAAIHVGHVVVPLSPTDSDETLEELVRRCDVRWVVCDDAARWRSIAQRCPSVEVVTATTALDELEADEGEVVVTHATTAIYSLLFTSGSTGAAKGAMRSYDAFNAMLASYGMVQPAIHLSFQPLSHLSERMLLPTVMLSGGQIGISRGGPALLEHLRQLRPTSVFSVPRLYEVIHARYRRLLQQVDEQAALAEMRGVFGDRLQNLSVGSAPCSPEVLAFLRRCFADIWVTEGYGSTECGTIAVDGRVMQDVDVKLVAVPSLGHDPLGTPSRGEILVRTPHLVSGYFGDDDATDASFVDGYFRTGDIGERAADGSVVVIGRIKSAVKLAQGEFVAPDRIEAALGGCPVVDQIYVHHDAEAGALVACVWPRPPHIDEAELLLALRAHANEVGLASYEIPRRVIRLAEPMSAANGLLTASGKVKRAAAQRRFGVWAATTAAAPAQPTTVTERLLATAHAVIGAPVDMHAPLTDALVDSLAVADLMAALGEALGRTLPLSLWFSSRTLGELVGRLESDVGASDPSYAADLALEPALNVTGAACAPPAVVMLTGATGFLGAHLLEAWLRDTTASLVCLVRGSRDRLLASVRARGIVDFDESRVRVVSGDLARPRLGLADGEWNQLATEVDTVLHAGASVSWLMRYPDLRAANVLGTCAMLELAAATRQKAFHFVSTISCAPSDGDESTTASREAIERASPYAVSKWIAEQHVRRANARGLPVSIYRPAMIAGHSGRGVGSTSDYLNRYLVGCARAGCFLDLDDELIDMTPVDYVARAIVTLVGLPPSGQVYHLTNIVGSMSYAELGRALRAAGVASEACDYTTFREAVLASEQSELRALAPYFPAEGFALRMGPWPDTRTRALLQQHGVRCPRIDHEVIARYVAALRAQGAMPHG